MLPTPITQQINHTKYIRNVNKTANICQNYILTWNLPALVRYLTPLNGLYFSPYMSSLFTLSPLTASWLIANWRLYRGMMRVGR